jgi:guanylate kinase
MKVHQPGRIVIISSPSGGGKTSICRRLFTPGRKLRGWRFSVSYTTRKKRRGEVHGREYYFVDDKQFDALTGKGFFAERCSVHLYRYGTPKKPLEEVISKGGVMVLDIDVQGAFRLKKSYPRAITIFVLPPSQPALRKRLRRRGTETVEQLKVRFDNARREMKLYPRFEYVVINDDLKVAVRQVLSIIESHPCRSENLNMEQIRSIVS